MKVKFLTIAMFVSCFLLWTGQALAQRVVIIEAGTPIPLKLDEKVCPDTHTSGAVVHFHVARDVKVGGYKVVKEGTPAVATVFSCTKQKAMGQPGEISFVIDYTTAVDGSRVPLRGSFAKTGEEKVTSTAALSFFICPLFAFTKGGEAAFAQGTEFKSYADADIRVTVR